MVNKSTLVCKNKIITKENLNNFFEVVDNKCKELDKIYKEEYAKNAILSYDYQEWTYKNLYKNVVCNIDFVDNTGIKFDKFSNFIEIFNQRIDEIKKVHLSLYLGYSYKEFGTTYKNVTSNFYINIEPDLMKCIFDVDDEEPIIKELYNNIESMFLNAPEKYDSYIKRYKLISFISDVSINFIPSIIISILLLFNSSIRSVVSSTYVLFPICCLVILLVINGVISLSGVRKLYNKIIPQKYAGFSNGNRVYKYDMDKLVDTCEVLIGTNINNLEYRDKIKCKYSFFKKLFLIDLIVLAITSIIVIFL